MLPPELERALKLLQLQDIDGLEKRFLSTDAFLEPWAVFRDSIFLLQPDAMPRTTEIFRAAETSIGAHIGIKRLDILWFYTQYDEDTLRYDPRADKWTTSYTSDSSVYGVIDKSNWGVEEYEKHLYVWLLQEFKVGKARNSLGFEYFELRNVCTVWEDVFVPIVNAVRASYSVKGRRHYGRLALFIESKRPSRLAFPENNVGVSEGSLTSPTPFRIVSVPKNRINSGGATFSQQATNTNILTCKQYDETERELRDVYPQYGGLVERPRFKQKMDDWLAEQRARAIHRKTIEKHGETQSFHPKVMERDDNRSPTKEAMDYFNQRHRRVGSHNSRDGSGSPMNRYSDNIRRSLSLNISRSSPPPKPKKSFVEGVQLDSPHLSLERPLHGVARQPHLPSPEEELEYSSLPIYNRTHKVSPSLSLVHPLSRPDMQREKSEQSVYTSIRHSNPFIEEFIEEKRIQHSRAATNDSVFSPMGPLSAIPRPLYGSDSIKPKKSFHNSRVPSYEGTGYVDEISHVSLQVGQMNNSRAPTRLPVPIAPVPYAGHLRVTSTDTYCNVPPKSVVWHNQSPPQRVAWPGFESEENLASLPPPIPPKSPERWKSTRGHVTGARSEQFLRENPHNVMRIVSRENIRAVLGSLSRENSLEDMVSQEVIEESERARSPDSKKRALQTYNTHMFPRKNERKGTPVGGWK